MITVDTFASAVLQVENNRQRVHKRSRKFVFLILRIRNTRILHKQLRKQAKDLCYSSKSNSSGILFFMVKILTTSMITRYLATFFSLY